MSTWERPADAPTAADLGVEVAVERPRVRTGKNIREMLARMVADIDAGVLKPDRILMTLTCDIGNGNSGVSVYTVGLTPMESYGILELARDVLKATFAGTPSALPPGSVPAPEVPA